MSEYQTNWGSRQLMFRFPSVLVDILMRRLRSAGLIEQ